MAYKEAKELLKMEVAGKEHPAEKDLKSARSDVETRIVFVNKSGRTVKLYWLDYKGARNLYQSLEDGRSYNMRTYLTHPWVITDERDNAWYVYFPDAQLRTIEIIAPKTI
jgi:von Hippel-Lindau disease tumor supressor